MIALKLEDIKLESSDTYFMKQGKNLSSDLRFICILLKKKKKYEIRNIPPTKKLSFKLTFTPSLA